MTQYRLAELLDVSFKTVQSWEQGKNKIPRLVEKVINIMLTYPPFLSALKGEPHQIMSKVGDWLIDPKSGCILTLMGLSSNMKLIAWLK